MALFIFENRDPFTLINNKLLHDCNLSRDVLGIFCSWHSLPQNWSFNMNGLVRVSHCSRSKISKTLKELALYGYFQREMISLGAGGFDYKYIFYPTSRLDTYFKYYDEKGFSVKISKEELYNILPSEYFESIMGI